jgi:hypothetical protein
VVAVALPVARFIPPSPTLTNVMAPHPVVAVVSIAVVAVDPDVASARRWVLLDDGGRGLPRSVVDDDHRGLR